MPRSLPKALAIFIVVILAVWFPFSLNRLDMSDIYWNMDRLHDAGNPLMQLLLFESGRFLNFVPMAIGYLLTPGSLIGQQLVLCAVLFFKAGVTFLFVRALLPHAAWWLGLVAALLTTFFPGDVDYFYFTVIHNHLSVAFALLAGYVLIRVVEANPGLKQSALLGWLVVLVLSITLAVAPNEGTHPLLALLPPALWAWKRWPATRRLWLAMAVWVGTQGFWAGVYVLMMRMGQTRFSESLAPTSLNLEFLQGIALAAQRLLLDAWANALGLTYWHWAVAVMALVVVAVLLRREPARAPSLPARDYAWLMGFGLVIVVVGYAPFAITPKNFTYSHTLFVSAVGSGLILTALAHGLITRLKIAPALGLLLVTGLVVKVMVSEHDRYIERVSTGQNNLRQVVSTVPSFTPGTRFLFVIDSPNEAEMSWHWKQLFGQRLATADRFAWPLDYLYAQHDARISYCVFGPESGPLLGCRAEGDQLVDVRTGEAFALEQVIAFRVFRGGRAVERLRTLPKSWVPVQLSDQRYRPGKRSRQCVEPDSRVNSVFSLGVNECRTRGLDP